MLGRIPIKWRQCPDMTIDVDWDAKSQIKQTNSSTCKLFLLVGGDATEAFEDVGHSTDARELMKDYVIGELPEVHVQQAECK